MNIPEKLGVKSIQQIIDEKFPNTYNLIRKETISRIPKVILDSTGDFSTMTDVKFTTFDRWNLILNTLVEGNLLQKEGTYMLKQILIGDHGLTSWLGIIIGIGQWAVDYLSTNTFNWKSFLGAFAIYIFGRSAADSTKTDVKPQ